MCLQRTSPPGGQRPTWKAAIKLTVALSFHTYIIDLLICAHGNVDVKAMQTVDVAAYENCQEYNFSKL